jgi:hypothetical protein
MGTRGFDLGGREEEYLIGVSHGDSGMDRPVRNDGEGADHGLPASIDGSVSSTWLRQSS